jgi:alanine racemase
MKRATYVEVNTAHLRHNIKAISKLAAPSKVMAVVKANSYGHGIDVIPKILFEEGVDFFAVAFADEAVVLRESGIDSPILVLVPGNSVDAELFCKYDLHALASSMLFMKTLSKEAQQHNTTIKVHLNLDTGMNRDGVPVKDIFDFYSELSAISNLETVGICTHFASSQEDLEFTRYQINLFDETIAQLKSMGCNFDYVHIANSAGFLNFPEARYDYIRPGISLYGVLPRKYLYEKIDLKPVMSLKTKINFIKNIEKGESVGYDRMFIADKPTIVATIPIGYGDGYFKALQGKVDCLIRGRRFPLIGTICMDESMILIGDDETIQYGDEVVLLGRQGDEVIAVEELAKIAGTIPYEILTNLNCRIPRKYV